ncbi:MAG: tetratricopeptide repeat protein [Pseudomonadota bacterium]
MIINIKQKSIFHLSIILFILAFAGCQSTDEKINSYYKSGEKFLKEKNYVKAGLEFRNVLKLDKKHIPAWFGLALSEEKQQKWENVTKFLLNIIHLDPKHIPAHNRLTSILLAGGQIPEALKYNNNAFELAPKDSDVLYLKAAIQFRLGEPDAALKLVTQSLEINPENTDAAIVMAAIQLEMGEIDGSLNVLNGMLARDEKNLGLNLFKIRVLEALKDTDQIEEILQKLIEFYPQNKSFQKALVNLFIQTNRKNDAEKQLLLISDRDPEDFEAVMDVVRFTNTFKGKNAAKELLKKLAEKKDKNQFQYQIALVQLLLKNNHFEKAEQNLQNIIKNQDNLKNTLSAQNYLAELYLARKQIDEANKIVTDTINRDKRNVHALTLRASLFLEKKQIEDAITDLRTALGEAPESARVLLLLAKAHQLNGATDLAEERLNSAVKAANYIPSYGLQYARSLIIKQEHARAEDVLTEILARQPNNKASLRLLAEVRLRQGNWGGAEQIAKTLSTLGETQEITRQIIAASLTAQKKYDESIAILKNIYSRSSETIQPLVSLYRNYIRADKKDDAELFLKSVLKSNPKSAEAYMLLGHLKTIKNQFETAEKTYQKAIAEQPQNALAYQALANFYNQQKRLKDANATLLKGAQILKDDFFLQLALAEQYELEGNAKQAMKLYEELHEKRPDSLIVSNNLASLYSKNTTDQKTLGKAYSIARRLKNSPIPYFKDTIGWIYNLRGEPNKAIPLLRDAVRGLPNIVDVRYHLGMSYLENAQSNLAIEELGKAYKLAQTNNHPLQSKLLDTLTQLQNNSNSTGSLEKQ